ncbi:MAG: sugar nucleotide-binding protein [Chthoniobacterales bacterium]|nr:sugar nucleotide-binding protein [Chthoniobacterales bacterium]
MIFVTGADGLVGGGLVGELQRGNTTSRGSGRRGAAGERHSLDLGAVEHAELPPDIKVAVLCAWSGGVAECAQNPEGTRRVNVEGNLMLIRRLKERGAKIVFPSTSLVFSGPETGARSPLSPGCEYSRQKAAVEEALDPSVDVILRITKVGETLSPRLNAWVDDLRSRRRVDAASWLRVAPVLLPDTIAGLAWLAVNFQPGIFQMSASRDTSYFDIARSLARSLGVPDALVSEDASPSRLFDCIPVCGSLEIAAPAGCAAWPDGRDVVQTLVEKAISC